MARIFQTLSLVVLTCSCIAFAFEAAPIQDLCVAKPRRSVQLNGLVCKHPARIETNDFFFSGLHIPGNTSTPYGSVVKPVNVAQLPGLNTLGISMVRMDFAPGGVNPPHIHPRGSEILTVLEGTLEAGFVTSNPEYRHFSKVLQKGDVFVFPVGLIHYQINVGQGNAVAIAGLNSQNPGTIAIGPAVFGSNTGIASDILAKALKMDLNVVDQIKSKYQK